MPIVDVERIDADATLEEVIDAFAKLQKAFDYLMQGGLDSKNAREFGGWSVGNTELQSKDKTVGMSTESTGSDDIRFWSGDLKTGSPNFKVTESGILSAIGALIMSALGYPRVELNNSNNLIGAYLNANNAVRVVPSRSAGTPAVEFFSGGSVVGFMQDLSPILALLTLTGGRDIQIGSGNKLYLTANAGIEMSGTSLKMNNINAYNGSFSYVKNVVAGAPSFGTISVTNGIITSVT